MIYKLKWQMRSHKIDEFLVLYHNRFFYMFWYKSHIGLTVYFISSLAMQCIAHKNDQHIQPMVHCITDRNSSLLLHRRQHHNAIDKKETYRLLPFSTEVTITCSADKNAVNIYFAIHGKLTTIIDENMNTCIKKILRNAWLYWSNSWDNE